jgi:hypothetical protein
MPATSTHSASHASASSDHGVPILPIVLTAAGGASLVAFGVLGAMSNAKHDELERECPSHQGCDPALADAASRGETYQTIANVSLAAGVLLLAAGTTLFVLDLGSDVQVAVTSHGAQLRGAL